MNEGDLEHIREVKFRHEAELMRKPNVVGVGIGQGRREGHPTDELSLIVNVTRKMSEDELAPEDRIPERLENVPVQVQAVGEIRAQDVRRERESRRPWAFWERWGAKSKIEEGLELVEDAVESLVDRKDSKSSDEEE